MPQAVILSKADARRLLVTSIDAWDKQASLARMKWQPSFRNVRNTRAWPAPYSAL